MGSGGNGWGLATGVTGETGHESRCFSASLCPFPAAEPGDKLRHRVRAMEGHPACHPQIPTTTPR